MDTRTSEPSPSAARRALVAAGILAPWLVVITSRQVPLYRGVGGGPPGEELVPWQIALVVVAAALGLRVARPTAATHAVALAVGICSLALLAASLGTPFANATADYCGDSCRTAIMGRMVAFFGWPILGTLMLIAAHRSDRRTATPAALDRAAWSAAWIAPTAIFGLVAAAAWARIVLS
jgi:hypothetical protein